LGKLCNQRLWASFVISGFGQVLKSVLWANTEISTLASFENTTLTRFATYQVYNEGLLLSFFHKQTI
jgi:hypothetical protein